MIEVTVTPNGISFHNPEPRLTDAEKIIEVRKLLKKLSKNHRSQWLWSDTLISELACIVKFGEGFTVDDALTKSHPPLATPSVPS